MKKDLAEEIKKIKQIAESFDYWNMNLTKASNIFEEIIYACDEALEGKQ